MWLALGRIVAGLGSRLVVWAVIASSVVGLVLYNRFWSCSATLKKVEVKEARIAGEVAAEAAGLKEDYRRIEATPHQTGPELLAQLNASAKRLRGP